MTAHTEQYVDRMVEDRRHFHMNPEEGWLEFETTAYLINRLESLGFEVLTGLQVINPDAVMGRKPEEVEAAIERARAAGVSEALLERMGGYTGCVGVLDTGRPGPVTALRFDIDCLAIEETKDENHLPNREGFASTRPGLSHACGHDGHTAVGLGVAQWLADNKETLCGRVKLVFQPAEETTGGAGRICETGVFEKYRVTRSFGLHLWPNLPEGSVWSRPGPMMARSNEVTLKVTGRSVHVSRAAEGLDALRAGVDWMNAAYAWTEALPPDVLRTLQFGRMTAGTVRNAVAGSAEIQGTLRTYDEDAAEMIRSHLRTLAAETAERTGCGLEVSFSTGYPAVWNNETLFERVSRDLGADAPQLLAEPVLAAEDFSFYQRCIPGVFFFLGVGPAHELHSPHFCWSDEAVIPAGIAFMKKIMVLP